jgi:hypothetical protein
VTDSGAFVRSNVLSLDALPALLSPIAGIFFSYAYCENFAESSNIFFLVD